jgi:hypothetical protein
MQYKILFGFAFACFALLGAYQFGWIGQGGGVKVVEGAAGAKTVVADLDDGVGTFSIESPADETYMLFFGSLGSPVSHGQFFGASLSEGQALLKRYPDFHRCDSPSAREFVRIAENVFVVAKPSLVGQLHRALIKARQRDDERGERLCARMRGNWLMLQQVETPEGIRTLEEFARSYHGRFKKYFLQLESLDVRDCKDVV